MRKILIYLVFLMALGLAGIVAYVSVNGLLKVFAGAGFLGLLFFTAIEIAKIVATSAIHTYRKTIGWTYTILLSFGVLISMIITSVGIYGFLSTSYQESYGDMIATENKVELIESKKQLLVDSKENLNKDIELKRERIGKILEVRKQQEVRLDSLYNKNWTTTAKRTEAIISDANQDMKNIESDVVILTERLNVINDSINSHSLKIIELEQNNEGAAELNSLKYLSTITGQSMDEVMKWFILLLIIIGDPMAVLMVIVFNKIVNRREDDTVSDTVSDAVSDAVSDTVSDAVIDAVSDKPIITKEYVDNVDTTQHDYNPQFNSENIIGGSEEPYEEPYEEITEEPIKKPTGKITREDIKEIKERGFSVPIPERKGNTIDKIGSNKEIRDGDVNTIYYKRSGGNPNGNR